MNFKKVLLSVLLAWIAPVLADTITTQDGLKLSGQPVEETEEHLKIRHKYGVLTIPKKEIRSREKSTYVVELKDGSSLLGQIVSESATDLKVKIGDTEKFVPLDTIKVVAEKDAPRPAPKLSPMEMAGLHSKATALWEKKEYAKAIEEYAKILAADPDDSVALYNTACGYALTNVRDKALDFLRKSLEAGFVNFTHIEVDTDLDSLRQEPAYKELFAKREEYTRKAAATAVARITKELGKKGIDAKQYREHYDRQNNFVYLHTRTDEEFSAIRKGLEEFADYQWKNLFQNRPGQPLYIVLLNSKDTPKYFPQSVGGMFSAGSNALVCGDSPAFKLVRASVTVHEFTHALHFADMAARRQQHPIWLVEGLATLFESADHEDGKVAPRHNHRLTVVQEALRRERTMPWTALTRLNHMQFMINAQLAYAQARYMLFYMQEKGLLKKFYDEYTKGAGYQSDRTAADAYEVVFGKPLPEVENDWKKWVAEQKVPPLPFLGIATKASGPEEVKIETVAPKSPAEAAGIKIGDVLLGLDGQPVRSQDDVLGIISSHKAGEEIEVQLSRGGEKLKLAIKLGERPSADQPPPRAKEAYLGFSVDSVDGKVVVKDVTADSPAAAAGLKAGMELLEVGGAKVTSTRDFLGSAKKAKVGDTLAVKVRDGDGEKTISLKVGEMPAK
jgi:C-terminal processing protease CtpA/Prc/RNase P/RNase MRP subunit p29